MRRRYLVAYDVSDPKRLRRVFRAMHGFGEPVQYSVFLCDLAHVELQLLRETLSAIINNREDRAMIVDLGAPGEGRKGELVVLGRQLDALPEAYRATIV